MSNEPSIEQMNEVIAIFNGWEKKNKREFVKGSQACYVWELKYHESWDALMPVWDKLRTALCQHIAVSDDNGGFHKFCGDLELACVNVEIEKAHKAVHNGIQWLNQQKQNNGTDNG